jgi:hypothetical protein
VPGFFILFARGRRAVRLNAKTLNVSHATRMEFRSAVGAVVKTSRRTAIVGARRARIVRDASGARIDRRCAGATLHFRARKFEFAERFNGKATRRTLNRQLRRHTEMTRFEQNCGRVASAAPPRDRAQLRRCVNELCDQATGLPNPERW